MLKKAANSFLTAFGLVCRVPLSTKYSTDFSLFGFFFPLIGIIVSGTVLGFYFLINPVIISSGITAFILLFIQYSAFNLFHFDGLLDCADAFFYNTTREKRLVILTDKRTGSFAIFAGASYLFLKIYLLSESVLTLNTAGSDWLWIVVLFMYPLSGRIAGTIMPSIIPPAEDPGLAELLADYPPLPVSIGIVLSLLFPAAIVYFSGRMLPIHLLMILPFAGAVISCIIVSGISKKLVEGYTGDSIGLSIEIGEIIHLSLMAEILGRLF
jgi:adenosylcobinamide-GDP ribazoletransferase